MATFCRTALLSSGPLGMYTMTRCVVPMGHIHPVILGVSRRPGDGCTAARTSVYSCVMQPFAVPFGDVLEPRN